MILQRWRRARASSPLSLSRTPLAPFIAQKQLAEYGLRLAQARPEAWTGNNDQIQLVIELASWTTKSGRSTAVERYARQKPPLAGSDEALVLAGLLGSVLTFWYIEDPHPVAGWLVRAVGGSTIWVVDERIRQIASHRHTCFLTRLFRCVTDGFAMSCSTIVPIPERLAEIIREKASLQQDAAGEVFDTANNVQLSRDSAYVTKLYASVLPAFREQV